MKYDTLKAFVNAKVYENTEQRITGGDMNDVLQSAIASLGAHYQMGGLVSPTDQITVGDEPVVFLATTPGKYTYFGGLVVADGEVALLVWSGTAWSKQTPDIATRTEVSQLGQEVDGINEELLSNVTTAPSADYITANMVSPGDTLVFELESINNLAGILRAEKTGYVFDNYITIGEGQTGTVEYQVPEDFLRIYTQSTANPMKIISCRRVRKGALDNLQDQADSPFDMIVPDALQGFVSFMFKTLPNDGQPVDLYKQFRISSIYMGGAWNLSMQIQGTTDGTTWVNYDGIDRLATDAPSPLPVVEFIESKYKRFTVVINWPMMGTISAASVSYTLKKVAPNYFVRKIQEQINTINLWPTWNDYELKDRTKQIVKVDASGNGDFTTIAAAYASITDSSYGNQYEVVVYPGTYNEYNLIPPKFTHTHGLIPGSVIVTSEGVSSTLPVFDQRVPCKLSNMTIISGTGYCVHQDQSSLYFTVLVNENLYCKKVYGQDVSGFGFRGITNPAILGIGSHLYGAKFIWNNCIFEDGKVGMHTVGGDSTIPANQHLIYKNCKLVNAYFDLGVAGSSSKVGNFVFEVDGLYTEPGRPSIMCVLGARTAGDNSYNFPWQIIGGNNRNLVVMTLNDNDTLTDDVWPNVNTNDITFVQLASGVSVSKGQFVDIAGNICTGSTDPEDVVGIVLEDGVSGGTVRVCVGSFAYDNAFNSAAFPVTTHDGNYGIGSDGRLLLNASTIIGRVKYNNFYRI